MKASFKAMTSILLMTTLASCSTDVQVTPVTSATVEYLWEHPIPRPQFVRVVTTQAGSSGFQQDVCIDIDEGIVWEPGEFGSDVYNGIQRTTKITVDGSIVNEVVFYQSTINIDKRDPNHNLIGSHGGGVAACFNTDSLTPGVHVAAVELRSKSGVQYTYTWSFRVP
jgi:hypothetical protein